MPQDVPPMNHSLKSYILVSLMVFAAIVVGLIWFPWAQPLIVELKISGYGIPENMGTSVVGRHGRRTLPVSFMVGRVNQLTMNDAHLYTIIAPGFVLFGFESSEPVDCMVVVDDEPNWGYDRPAESILVNISGCYEFYDVLEIGESGVLSFCFRADPETLSNVTLTGEKDAWFTAHRDPSDDVNTAVDTARAFLSLNGVEAGRYLNYSVEYGVPNYYWQKQFQYDNLASLVYQGLPEPCTYIAVRFEQKQRPGHYYEVWVEQGTHQVVGGDTCR